MNTKRENWFSFKILPLKEESLDRKTKDQFLGPYEIFERTSRTSYVLWELDGIKLLTRIGVTRLLLYITRDHPFIIEHQIEEESDSGTEITSESQDTKEPDTNEFDISNQPEIAHAGTCQTMRHWSNRTTNKNMFLKLTCSFTPHSFVPWLLTLPMHNHTHSSTQILKKPLLMLLLLKHL